MRMPPLNYVDPVVGSAAGAVLFTTLTQCVPIRRLELWSEMVCWVILPFLLKYTGPSHSHASSSLAGSETQQRWSSRAHWIFAIGITAAAFYRAESTTIGFFPMLTPLLLAVQKYVQSPTIVPNSSSSSLVNTIRGTALIAAPAVLSLSHGDLIGSLGSMGLVASLLVAYAILTPGLKIRILSLSSIDVETNIKETAIRTNILLLVAIIIQIFVLGPSTSDISSTLLSGLLKSASWFFIIQTVRQTSWCIATTIGTFALACARNPFSQSSQLQAMSHIAVSGLALFQTISLLPKQGKGRTIIWCFLLASIIPFVLNEHLINETRSSSLNTFDSSHVHPAEALTQVATQSFSEMLKRQSQTYSDAVKEYRRRYKVDPPPGFEAWFEFARKHHSPIIDEFDVIHHSISPFWKVSGKEFLESMDKLYKTPQSETWLCEFSGKDARTKCHHPHRTYDRHYSYLFDKLLWNLPDVLPNAKFLINHFDEPRVIVPPQSQDKKFQLTDLSRKSTWDALTSVCSQSQHKAREAYSQSAVETYGLPFVKNHFSESDLCRHTEYSTLHASFVCPKTFRLIQGSAPVMSTGAFSTMGDILIPSPAYVEFEFQYNDTQDVPWSHKKNKLYWTGSTTGGYAMDDQWQNYQRQRFVNLAQNLGQQQHSYLQKKDGLISRVKSRFLNSRLFDVAFTRIFQCDSKYCRDQSTHFNVKPWADKDAAFGSKLVFDLDGNGISGRYYKLLSSNSLPLKQTLFREWHDERLMPWVHYVPVSQSLEELPELVSYLTSTESGQKIAEEIAQRGRDWMTKAVREVDMTIYTYRLILELARLQDPARKAI